MASITDVYDLANYLDYHSELGIYDFIGSKFVTDLKKLPIENAVNSSGLLLDSISFKYYNTELLWWVIGLFNNILDPLVEVDTVVYLPSLSSIETLLLRTIEERL